MVEQIEDLNLPNSVVTRLMKECLPSDVRISSETRIALTRATSVFVLYITGTATAVAQEKNQRLLTADHVLAALAENDFEAFVKPLQADLENYRKLMKSRKNKKAAVASATATATSEEPTTSTGSSTAPATATASNRMSVELLEIVEEEEHVEND